MTFDLARAVGALLLILLLVGWGAGFLFEQFARGMSTTGSRPHLSDRIYYGLGAAWVVLCLVGVLAVRLPGGVAFFAFLAAAGSGMAVFAKPTLQRWAYDLSMAWERDRAESVKRAVEALRDYAGDVANGGWDYHYVWDDDLLVELRTGGTTLQANPIGRRTGTHLALWRTGNDDASQVEARQGRVGRAVDAAGALLTQDFEVGVVDLSSADYDEALRRAQRRYNRP